MSTAEIYPWLVALHVASAMAFTGGVLAVSIFLAAVPANDPAAASTAHGVRRWDQAVTMPAMLAVWVLGLAAAITGDWFAGGWLQAKLAFVLILSGLHGMQSGHLRRLSGGEELRKVRTSPVVIVCVIAIAMLAVAKPF